MDKRLEVPDRKIDVILDTDAYNEVDDQFAIAYLLRCGEKLNVLGFTAAPYFNSRSESPEDGMEKSYAEIRHILTLAGRTDLLDEVYKGSRAYLPDEKTPLDSPAARQIVAWAKAHTPEEPLYVVAIGAITNVASAFLIDPSVVNNTVVVWLGGHGYDYEEGADTKEFNMRQDVAAARVVMGSAAPFVQLPCNGVVSEFRVTEAELRIWLVGKGDLCDYLARHALDVEEKVKPGQPWSRVIWDVTAVAWLMNDGGRFMKSRLAPLRLPGYDGKYGSPTGKLFRYVFKIDRDALMCDLFRRLLGD